MDLLHLYTQLRAGTVHRAVSYTHLDVYKRQVLNRVVSQMVDEDTEFLNVYYGKEIKKPQADVMLKALEMQTVTVKKKSQEAIKTEDIKFKYCTEFIVEKKQCIHKLQSQLFMIRLLLLF